MSTPNINRWKPSCFVFIKTIIGIGILAQFLIFIINFLKYSCECIIGKVLKNTRSIQMSRQSKITLTVAMMISAGVVSYVHFKQTSDRDKLHEGVVRDVLRQQKRKVENTYALQQQIGKTKLMKSEDSKIVIEN